MTDSRDTTGRDKCQRELLAGTSTSLLIRIAHGEAGSWERMVDLYYPLVFNWCRRRGLQPHDAVDVAQEVFAAVAAGLSGFRRDRSTDSFRAWLRGITRYKLADYWRERLGREQAAGGTDAQLALQQLPELADPASGEQELSELALLARRALPLIQGEFEPRTWNAFWRAAVDGQPARAVAEELDISPNAVYLAKSRVLARLRLELRDQV